MLKPVSGSVDNVTIFSDGGSRGNPGPAAIGFIIKNKNGDIICREGQFIGLATNNRAEYWALTEALKRATSLGIREARCFLDSELVARQLNGQYKVRDNNIKKYFQNLREILPNFSKISFNHVTRNNNFEADRLVNEALDAQEKELNGQN